MVGGVGYCGLVVDAWRTRVWFLRAILAWWLGFVGVGGFGLFGVVLLTVGWFWVDFGVDCLLALFGVLGG